MSRNVLAVLWLLAFVSLPRCSADSQVGPGLPPAKPNDESVETRARRIFADLRNLANQAQVRMFPPYFWREGPTPFYDLGQIFEDELGLARDDPYQLPLTTLLHVEALRSVIARATFGTWSGKMAGLLSAPLRQIEDSVYSTVLDIESTTDRKQLDSKLKSRAQEIDQGYAKVRAVIESPANSPFDDGAPFRPRTMGWSIGGPFDVRIITDPPKGRIRIVTDLAYRLYLIRQLPRQRWEWRELIREKEPLIGRYFFLAQWPDGRQNEGSLEVLRADNVTFSPKAR